MIAYRDENKVFYLHMNDSTYVMMINETNHLEHLYYGPTIEEVKDVDTLRMRYQFEHGSSTSYNEQNKGLMLQQLLLECGTYGKGDYREPMLHIECSDGTRTLDLTYHKHEIVDNLVFKNMPQVDKQTTLAITLRDAVCAVDVVLYYTLFEEDNVLVRNAEVINNGQDTITIDRALSMNLDMRYDDYELRTIDGAWIRERHIHDVPLRHGTLRIDSKKGVSSSDHNPFLILKQSVTNESFGKGYGFALVYSGNYEANVEIQSHDLLRVNIGINSFDFRYPLQSGEHFITPEVLITSSNTGMNTLSNQFHNVINNALVSKDFRHKERPIVINNWEATYFDFNEKKLLAIAKKAQQLGIELFCLDDGWFAKRNDDFASLGDWHYNPKKLRRGLQAFAQKLKKIGLAFGLWVEPEMVNIDSELYRQHPEWAIQIPSREPSLGRNQLMLDLANHDVQEYLIETLTSLFSSCDLSYVKWDMNRNISDVFSTALEPEYQGAYHHLYVMGLYRVLDALKTTFPSILFESCSSGGNRFDLGMLYYMPQTWTSDNTDAYERLLIQEGTSLLYPLSSISNHVSGDRSHQVFRHTPIESRFNVACFGVLGYELDVTELTPFDTKAIKQQIAFYKQHRALFQFGRFTRLRSVRDSNYTVWMVQNQDHTEALMLYMQDHAVPNPPMDVLGVPSMAEGTYHITNRLQYINIRTFGSLVNEALPIKLKVHHTLHNLIANRYMYESETIDRTMTSNQLNHAGLLLPHKFTGTGHGETDMILEDYGSRMYHIKQIK